MVATEVLSVASTGRKRWKFVSESQSVAAVDGAELFEGSPGAPMTEPVMRSLGGDAAVGRKDGHNSPRKAAGAVGGS